VHRTYHSISLCFPNERDDVDRIVREVYSDLERFNHFKPNFSSIYLSGDGRTAHFSLDNVVLALASVPAGSIDVELVRRPDRSEVLAVTTGLHPLVGVRRWRAAALVTNTRYRARAILVETEAYEQANGLLNWIGHPAASIFQDQMWEIYLNNIAGHWKKTKKAIPFNYRETFSGSSDNPLRWRLPPSLQNSRYY